MEHMGSSQRSIAMLAIVGVSNPRTYFDPVEMETLIASVRQNGVLQSVLVRSLGVNDLGVEEFALIAGERRFRAATAVGLTDIPALIADVSAEKAAEFALIENTVRADMSPTDEAVAAFELMAKHGNDKDEVQRRLSWPRTKLEQRLALMRCAPEVRVALNERKILLGHAELLAAVPIEKQVSSLSTIIENKLTVAYVKQKLAKVAQKLPNAIFDQSECLTCHFNTACQTGLFAETIDDGFCTNSPCFEKKTLAALDTIKDQLSQDYPVVRIIAVGDASTSTPLQADGNMGVGDEQAKACRACEHFGCSISALPESAGSVERDLCFDTACNATKVVEFIRSTKPKVEKAQAAVSGPNKGEAKGAASKSPAKKKAVVQTPAKVKEYRVALWRAIAKKELLKRGDDAITVLVALCAIGSARHINSSNIGDGFKKLTGSATTPAAHGLTSVLTTLREGESVRTTLLEALSASAMSNVDERQLIQTLQFLRIDMKAHWQLCAEFLNLMTKSEIEVVAEELGLKAALGDKFAKIVAGKKDALVKSLLTAEGFDYSQAVPAVLIFGPVDVEADLGDDGEDTDSDGNEQNEEVSESD